MAKTKARKKAAPAPSDVKIELIYEESIRETYIDGYQGVMYRGGMIKFNLYSDALDMARNKAIRRIVERLTMSLPTLLAVHDAMGRMIDDLRKDGIIEALKEPEKP